MGIQLISLPAPKGGRCYVCGDPDCVVVAVDTSIGHELCSECVNGALSIEKTLCVICPAIGIRHPFPHEHFPNRFMNL